MFVELNKTISLGPLNIPLILITVILSWFIYLAITGRVFKNQKDSQKKIDNIIFNIFFIIFIVWKLSPLIFQFSTVKLNPSAMLYLPGGIAGLILGAGAALAYLTVVTLRKHSNDRGLMKRFALSAAVLAAVFLFVSTGTTLLSVKLRGVEASSGISEGSEAPEFTLQGVDGKKYSLSDYENKIIILNFWASWCPPCKAELPELNNFYENLDSEQAEFLSINMFDTESGISELRSFIEEQGIDFPVILDETGRLAYAYRISSIPTTVIIAEDGIISDVRQGAVTEDWLNRNIE